MTKKPAVSLSKPRQLNCLWWVVSVALVLQTARQAEATSSFPNPTPQGNSWAPCGFAAEQLAVEGNGSTYGSCLACDPTSFVCPAKCQPLIDALYSQCDGVYAPQDEYFDPAHTLSGYWNDNFGVLRVQAARCGCSGSPVAWRQHLLVWQLVFTIAAARFMLT